MKPKEKNKLLTRYTFSSCKNLRKKSLTEIKEHYAKYLPSSISGEHKDFSYFIVWIREGGISSYVAKNDKIVAETWREYYVPKEKVVSITKRYINYLSKNLETLGL